MSHSFVKKRMEATFELGTGSFGETGMNRVTLSGLRMSASIVKAGGASMGSMQLQVWGMSDDEMNKLSTLGLIPTALRRNSVILSAGDDESGLGVVFQGTIQDGWADFNAMPNNMFHVVSYAGQFQNMKPIPVSSYRGSADVATIMSNLAAQMGVAFENSGVVAKLANPYYPGSAWEQAQRCADAAHINVDLHNGKLAIWPKGSARGSQIPLISPATGMIGYPTFTSKGVVVTMLYNPSIGYGTYVQVESDLKPANGKWYVYMLAHQLDAELPQGNWLTRIEASPPGFGPPIA